MDSAGRTRGCPIRKFPDQSVCPAPRDLSQVTTSFIASVCQGIHHEPFVAWPINLYNASRSWIRILSNSPGFNLKLLQLNWIVCHWRWFEWPIKLSMPRWHRKNAIESRLLTQESNIILVDQPQLSTDADCINWLPRIMHPWDALFFPDLPMQLSRFCWTSLQFLRITVSPASYQPNLNWLRPGMIRS